MESFAKGNKHFEKCLGKLIFDERTQTYFPHCKGVIFSITVNKKAVAYETVMSIANFPDSCNKDANLLLAIKTTHGWRSSKMKLVIVK